METTLSNGISGSHDQLPAQSQHLGKRKRLQSDEPENASKGDGELSAEMLEKAFSFIKQHDRSTTILNHPLPSYEHDKFSIKRPRIDSDPNEPDTIRSRISDGVYQSLEDLINDINQIKNVIKEETTSGGRTPNGNHDTSELADLMKNGISKITTKPGNNQMSDLPIARSTSALNQALQPLQSDQVLSLRSQTEHGIRRLFSGLPSHSFSEKIEAKSLPNGFELADALVLDSSSLAGKDSRKFGDVFASPSSTKTLEMPRGARQQKETILNFVPPYDSIPSANRDDYRLATLKPGSWLRYSVGNKPSDSNQVETTRANLMFRAAYSTFAPTSDNGQSMVSSMGRSRLWWKHNFTHPQVSDTHTVTNEEIQEEIGQVTDEDLERMVNNFISDESSTDVAVAEDTTILEEISDLMETLSSRQMIRNLEVAKGPSSASSPSKDENDVHEMLRLKLQMLISSLPPFAVAKLNGDQLQSLNISTHLMVQPVDFMGTALPDENTLRRNRVIVQNATSTIGRAPASVQNRAPYVTPASAYNAQARAYNNLGPANYTSRPSSTSYATPQPMVNGTPSAYSQPPYRANAPMVHTPSIQQFQRPMVNGHASTAAVTANNPHAYLQRPSQPGYQQRAQESSTYARPESIPRQTFNGDTPLFQPRQYTTPALPQQSGKAHYEPRPSSGTPQTQPRTVNGIRTAGV